MKKVLSIFVLMIISITLLACNKKIIKAEYITITNENIYLNVDSEVTLEYKIIPADTTNKDVSIVSNNDEIATVTNGVLKGLKIGNTIVTISLKEQPEIKKEIIVNVVDKLWPSVSIKSFAGFDLPAFPNFTSVNEVKTDESLKLEISGVTNDSGAMYQYKDLLISLGWILDGGFDEHAGKFKHNDFEYTISLHNNMVHNGTTIDLLISKKDHDHNHEIHTWEELSEEVFIHFNVELPLFEGITEFNFISEEAEFKFNIKVDNRKEKITAYQNVLNTNGWVPEGTPTTHAGTYIKDNVEISYHESHDDEDTIDFTISKEHNHEHEKTWNDAQKAVSDKFKITINKLENVNEMTIIEKSNSIIVDVTIASELLESSLEDFLNTFNEEWIKNPNNDSHVGYLYKKPNLTLSYHNELPHGRNIITFTFSIIDDEPTGWPSDEISNDLGFSMPDFKTFNQAAYDSKEKILTINGVIDRVVKVNEYIEQLETLGWTIFKSNPVTIMMDHYLHNYRITIMMMPSSPEVVDIVFRELALTWDDITRFINNEYKIEIPNFENIKSIKITNIPNEFVFNAKVTNREASIIAYQELLTSNGWVPEGTPTTHAGTYIKDDVEISYHESHDDIETIDFTISKEHDHEHGFPNDEIFEHFGFKLPEFPGHVHFKVNHLSNGGLEIVISDIEDDKEALEKYDLLLINDSWIKSSTNSFHGGSYTKDGVNALITYHNSMDHGGKTIEYKITKLNDDTVNEWPNKELKENVGFELPEFPNSKSAFFDVKEEYSVIEILGVEDDRTEVFNYYELLEADGWVNSEIKNAHGARYFKDGLDYFIIVHNLKYHGGDVIEIQIHKIITEGFYEEWPVSEINELLPNNNLIAYSGFSSISLNDEDLSVGKLLILIYGATSSSIDSYINSLEGWVYSLKHDGYINNEKTFIMVIEDHLSTYRTIDITIQKISEYPSDEINAIIKDELPKYGELNSTHYVIKKYQDDEDFDFKIYDTSKEELESFINSLLDLGWFNNEYTGALYKEDNDYFIYYSNSSDFSIVSISITTDPSYGKEHQDLTKLFNEYGIPLFDQDSELENLVYSAKVHGYSKESIAIDVNGSDLSFVSTYEAILTNNGFVKTGTAFTKENTKIEVIFDDLFETAVIIIIL
ncbi:Ig-like domain-containing protein [Haploplasma axanthum]|uniref:Bacterial Ig-like domain (Group 2) n=1 Tax=Haploplasma axanthum TaxID=29552 RepID=A0A449BFQ8_HAPAX|nr:Ig-like domain-containing protein [Haploplasma axanthum]VEU81297.1 Bacterial Ig-like domain (group 2) [Haploplasma axanthum]